MTLNEKDTKLIFCTLPSISYHTVNEISQQYFLALNNLYTLKSLAYFRFIGLEIMYTDADDVGLKPWVVSRWLNLGSKVTGGLSGGYPQLCLHNRVLSNTILYLHLRSAITDQKCLSKCHHTWTYTSELAFHLHHLRFTTPVTLSWLHGIRCSEQFRNRCSDSTLSKTLRALRKQITIMCVTH